MRKIKLFPSTHVEVRIHVTDEMERDYWKCREEIRRKAEAGEEWTFKCAECSWNDVKIADYCSACTLNGLEELIRGEKSDEPEKLSEWKKQYISRFERIE